VVLSLGSNVHARTNSKRTAILLAAYHNPSLTPLLVDAGADVNDRDENGYAVLHYLCGDSTVPLDIIQYVLDRGADPNVCSKYGTSVFHMPFLRASLMRLLVQRGGNINIRNMYGETPLHVHHPYDTSVRDLLCNGANPNIRDYSGRTPLDYASGQHYETMRLLFLVTKGEVKTQPLRRLVALYSAMIWKRSDVGGLSSRILIAYLRM
jgi:ankyrin repeat protein